MHIVDDEIFTQGTVADLQATGLLDRVASLAPEKHRKRNCHESTSDSSEYGVTGDDERSSNSDEDTGSVVKKSPRYYRAYSSRTGRKLVQEEERQTVNVKWDRTGLSVSSTIERGIPP